MAVLPTIPASPTGNYAVDINSGQLTVFQGDNSSNPNQYIVNVPKTMERIRQPLYNYLPYVTAGQGQLSFFQQQVGGAVTQLNTNLQLAGQISAPQSFLVDGVGIDYLPGTTAAPPVLGPRADAATGAMNDFYTVMKSGVLNFIIGNKPYLTMSPMMSMPPRSHMDGNQAVTTNLTTGAATQTIMQVPFVTGPIFKTVPMLLEASQNFSINITWPAGNVAIPSGDALAQLGVWLYGTLYRPAQ